MTSDDRVALIRAGTVGADGPWADLGSGAGAFTRALGTLLGDSERIYAVDRDSGSLLRLKGELGSLLPLLQVIHADFRGEVPLPPLSGILIANALHFHADACAILAHARQWLKPGGRLIIVEYDIENPNPWVPHPLPWSRLPALLQRAGFFHARLLARRPSRFHRWVYAAASDTA
jgi:SAM-dependent methyltransferase